jgi:hypothetical protein
MQMPKINEERNNVCVCVCVCVSELFSKSQNKRCSTGIPLYGFIWFWGLELTLIRDMCARRSYTLRHVGRWVGVIKGVGVFDRERVCVLCERLVGRGRKTISNLDGGREIDGARVCD